MRVFLSVGGEHDFVLPGHSPRRGRSRCGVLVDGGDGVFGLDARDRRVAQVPHESVEAGLIAEMLRRTDPIRGNRKLGIGSGHRIGAGIGAHELAAAVEDLKLHVAGGAGAKIVIKDGAVGRVLPGGLIRRQGSVGPHVPMHAIGEPGLEQISISRESLVVELTQWGDVVENPEAATVGGNGEVVIFHHDIAHRRCGQVQTERLPVIAVVEGYVDGAFGSGEEHALTFRVLANGIDVFVVGNAVDDLGPGLAAVAGAQDVRPQVVEAQRVDSCIGGVGIGVAGFDARDFLPCSQSGRRNVVPILAAVSGEPEESVVRPGPDAIDVERRGADGINDAALRGLHFAGKDADARGDIPGFACEVGADLLP